VRPAWAYSTASAAPEPELAPVMMMARVLACNSAPFPAAMSVLRTIGNARVWAKFLGAAPARDRRYRSKLSAAACDRKNRFADGCMHGALPPASNKNLTTPARAAGSLKSTFRKFAGIASPALVLKGLLEGSFAQEHLNRPHRYDKA
jgi:hypothetical protein